MSIIVFLVVGFIVGLIARALVPGRDPIGIVGTTLLGIVGSFVGGFLARVLFNDPQVGWFGSIAGAVIVLLIYRAVVGRRRTYV